MAVNTLKVGISDLSDDDCSERRRIQFVIEQLKLMSASKFARHRRHYTPQTTVMAYMRHAAKRVSVQRSSGSWCPLFAVSQHPEESDQASGMDCRIGLNNTAYLKLRTSRSFAFAPLRLLCSSSLTQSLQIINCYHWYHYKVMETSTYHILSFYGRFMLLFCCGTRYIIASDSAKLAALQRGVGLLR